MPSQWGPVHLFDLCLRFGHSGTARAVALHGVEGCRLEEHHLAALPDARRALVDYPCMCECRGWEICSFCCWGFPVDTGVWMKDWDANLRKAARAAKKAAQTPLVSGILEIFSKDEALPFTMSNEAAARLLDISILCGKTKAAANLAKSFSVRPLRRWRGNELRDFYDLPLLRDPEPVISAALWSGADFQDLHVLGMAVPLLARMALDFDSEHWEQLGHFFESTPRWPSCYVELGEEFLSMEMREDRRFHCWISMDKVRNALRSGWDLKYIWKLFIESEAGQSRKHAASLLELAIFCGNSDCADALATAGVQLRDYCDYGEDCLKLLKRACRGESVELCNLLNRGLHVGSAFECKSAAVAAACAFLKKSFKHEGAEKGVAIYQVLTKKFHPRGIPMALVHDILAFAMEPPKILDQLDLWDELSCWMSSLQVKSNGNDEALSVGLDEEVTGVEDSPELGSLQPVSAMRFLVLGKSCVKNWARHELHFSWLSHMNNQGTSPTGPPEASEADVKSTDELMEALQRSRDQVPVLNMHGVCVSLGQISDANILGLSIYCRTCSA